MENKSILQKLKKPILLVAIFSIIEILILGGIINSYYQITLFTICINIMAAVSLNLITGFTGQFSLGHAGFMAIGAYVCAIVIMRIPGVPGFLLGVFGGAVLAAIVGCIIGIPTLRLRGDYLAIATLGLSEIIRIIILNLKITNGAAGLSYIPKIVNWPWIFVFTAGTVLLISNFLNSSHGRACISVREDEIAAESMGINSTKYKVAAFTMGAFFAGVSGAVYAAFFTTIKPDIFGFMKSIDMLVIVVLGGLGSLPGSIIAAIVLAIINMVLQQFTAVRMIVYSLLLIIIMFMRQKGLMSAIQVWLKETIQKIIAPIRNKSGKKAGNPTQKDK